MYKLLLATNDPTVVEAFSAVKWEALGFKQPRVVSTAEEALSSLRVNHADAVAIGLPKEQDDLLVEQLLEKNPMLPIMAVSTKPGVIESYAVELRRLLGRINADVSNDAFSTADLLKECRHEFFRALMDGRATSEEDVLRHLRLIRSKMDPTKPCVVAELEIPADNDFLRGRWQYGSDRLEVALRNIFGVEAHGLRILACVLPGDRIVLLGCPMLFHEGPDEEASITGILSDHIRDSIEHVDEYMGIDLRITSIRVLPCLTALAHKD